MSALITLHATTILVQKIRAGGMGLRRTEGTYVLGKR